MPMSVPIGCTRISRMRSIKILVRSGPMHMVLISASTVLMTIAMVSSTIGMAGILEAPMVTIQTMMHDPVTTASVMVHILLGSWLLLVIMIQGLLELHLAHASFLSRSVTMPVGTWISDFRE